MTMILDVGRSLASLKFAALANTKFAGNARRFETPLTACIGAAKRLPLI
jgi:hypothetical protein